MLSSFQAKSLLLRSYVEWHRGSQMYIYRSLKNGLISLETNIGPFLAYRYYVCANAGVMVLCLYQLLLTDVSMPFF